MARIVILGAAESGIGAAVLAQKQGFDVFVSDKSPIKDKYKEQLNKRNIPWEEGQHTAELILNADEVIKSPGIPKEVPMVKEIAKCNIPIISEIEFAGRYTNSKMICITGSNGKTTTTSLIYHIFKEAGYDVSLAGNIGKSLALQVAEAPHAYYIIEISSFQLDDMYDFRANTAVLLNITPDHLDRYEYKMQLYTDAKMRIIQNQTKEDSFVYWADDDVVAAELHKYNIEAQQLTFSENASNSVAACVDNGKIVVKKPVEFTMSRAELSLLGRHNLYNSLAAALAAAANGVDVEAIKQGLRTFAGVEHRLEYVTTANGVRYINDSKATNVDACRWALESMTTPTILILGGLDKGNDYNEIKQLVLDKCKALVFMGADNSVLHEFFDGLGIEIADTHSMEECMQECKKRAVEGDTILLSPCCASFDLFKNMEDRGEQFKTWARKA